MTPSRVRVTFLILMTVFLTGTMSNKEDNNEERYSKFIRYNEDGCDGTFECYSKHSWRLSNVLKDVVERFVSEDENLSILIGNGTRYHRFGEILLGNIVTLTRRRTNIVRGSHRRDSISSFLEKPTCYLILTSDLQSLVTSLSRVGKRGNDWNPRALYIGIATSKTKMIEMMTILAREYMIKVIIVLVPPTSQGPIEIYTWRPYYPANHCATPTWKNIVRLGIYSPELIYHLESEIQPGVVPKNFNDCPINGSFNIWLPYVFPEDKFGKEHYHGIEINIVRAVMREIKFSLNARVHDLSPPKNWEELEAGGSIPTIKHLVDRDISFPYVQDSFVWVFSTANDSFGWENFVGGFKWEVWMSCIVTSCVVVAFLAIIGFHDGILWIWGSFWEQSYKIVPRRTRGFLAPWLLLCLHLSVAYKTKLVSFLSDPSTTNVIHDARDLVASDLKLSFLKGAEEFFDEEDETDRMILNTYHPCEPVTRCYEEIPTGRALFTNNMLIDHLQAHSPIVENIQRLPPSMSYNVITIFRKGHPGLEAFDKTVLSLVEFGFVRRFMTEHERLETKQLAQRKLSSDNYDTFSLDQIQTIIAMLSAGLTVASISFFGELVHYHYHRNRKSKVSKFISE